MHYFRQPEGFAMRRRSDDVILTHDAALAAGRESVCQKDHVLPMRFDCMPFWQKQKNYDCLAIFLSMKRNRNMTETIAS